MPDLAFWTVPYGLSPSTLACHFVPDMVPNCVPNPMKPTIIGIIAAPIQGWVMDAIGPNGSRVLFGMAALPAASVIGPAVLGWLYEERRPRGERNPRLSLCVPTSANKSL